MAHGSPAVPQRGGEGQRGEVLLVGPEQEIQVAAARGVAGGVRRTSPQIMHN